MSLIGAELRRAKLRFSLLAGAVGLLVFLILFQQALLGGLITQFIGAVRNQSAPVLVYAEESRGNLESSRVPPPVVEQVAAVEGVARAEPLGEGTFTVRVDGELADASLWGYPLDGPGAPTALAEGRLPTSDDEAVVSTGDEDGGFDLGATIVVEPGGSPIEVVGTADESKFSGNPVLYVSSATYEAARRTANPDATTVLPSAVAVEVSDGASPAAVAERISAEVDGVTAYTRDAAADASPGVSAVQQSFFVILGLFYIVVPLVVGLFFLIITLQKANALTLLRALGAKPAQLVRNLLVQVVLVVVGGVAIATILLWGASQGTRSIGVSVEAGPVLLTGAVVLGLALLASVAAARRVLAIDPIRATTGTDVTS